MRALTVGLALAALAGWADRAAAQDWKLLLGGARDRQEIRILDALYGQDQQVCRAYDVVARACDGRDYCEVEADSNLCGDPYANVRKQLFIGYDCGDGRRSISVDEGQIARVYCLSPGSGGGRTTQGESGSGLPSGWRRGAIYIEGVEYGVQGRSCDAIQPFVFACNGQPQCRLKVDNKLCGDPARGLAKAATVRYWCNERLHEETVREGQTARLDCD